jgi:hypothetical protein
MVRSGAGDFPSSTEALAHHLRTHRCNRELPFLPVCKVDKLHLVDIARKRVAGSDEHGKELEEMAKAMFSSEAEMIRLRDGRALGFLETG